MFRFSRRAVGVSMVVLALSVAFCLVTASPALAGGGWHGGYHGGWHHGGRYHGGPYRGHRGYWPGNRWGYGPGYYPGAGLRYYGAGYPYQPYQFGYPYPAYGYPPGSVAPGTAAAAVPNPVP
jgi:hypothetical protein